MTCDKSDIPLLLHPVALPYLGHLERAGARYRGRAGLGLL